MFLFFLHKYLYFTHLTTTDLLYYTSVLYIDIDECLTGTSRCEQLCQNTPGSFTCSCFLGYTLKSDHRSCVKAGIFKEECYTRISFHGLVEYYFWNMFRFSKKDMY